jgi:hypothetical protein
MDMREAYCERGTEFLYTIHFNSMLQWFTERRSSNILPLSIPNVANSIRYILENLQVYISTLLYSSYIHVLCVAQTASSDIRYAVRFVDNHKYVYHLTQQL